MTSLRIMAATLAVFLTVGSQVQAGTTYRITSTDGNKSMDYEVKFGGGSSSTNSQRSTRNRRSSSTSPGTGTHRPQSQPGQFGTIVQGS
jgi:hypothetical protein